MTSRRAAGPEGQRDPRSPGRSSGSTADSRLQPRSAIFDPQAGEQYQQPPRQQFDNLDREERLTGSLQNLSQQPLVVPPPVPPRTPQVRQSRGRRIAPALPVQSRPPPPPLPARPAVKPTISQEDRENVFVRDLGGETISVSVEEPRVPSTSSQSIDHRSEAPDISKDGNEEPSSSSSFFARCTRGASTSRSRDEGDAVPEDIESETMEEASPNDDPGASRSRAIARNQSGTGARLRPPLAGTAGVSADSGTGDTGSAEIPVDGAGTPLQHHLPVRELCGGPGDGDRDDGGDGDRDDTADDELADDVDELHEMRHRKPVEDVTIRSPRQPPAKNAKQQVKPFTKESLDRLESRHVQLVRDYGFQPKRKTSVEDGGVLPNKFEPFPQNLYGRPLEEIDNFIYDEVCKQFIPLKYKYLSKS